MRLLILGGTGFLGRHLVAAALARGHELTLFDRGRTAPELFPDLDRLYGDRESDLGALAGRTWDAVIDASGFTRAAVAASASGLSGRVAHYTFVSSVSAYADLTRPGVDEDAPLAADGPGYGPQKAAAERTLERAWPRTLLRIRPGVLIGPSDQSGRFDYWVRRVAEGGEVLVPGPPGRHVQVLDARDLADWLVGSAESGREGVYNAVGPREPLTMAELLETCRTVTGSDAVPRWLGPDALRRLPLLSYAAGFHQVDGRRAVGAGLRFRPLADTVRDVLALLQPVRV
jgi:2'-hydroxyisoflavone reductase